MFMKIAWINVYENYVH